jgi:hypothetical protein
MTHRGHRIGKWQEALFICPFSLLIFCWHTQATAARASRHHAAASPPPLDTAAPISPTHTCTVLETTLHRHRGATPTLDRCARWPNLVFMSANLLFFKGCDFCPRSRVSGPARPCIVSYMSVCILPQPGSGAIGTGGAPGGRCRGAKRNQAHRRASHAACCLPECTKVMALTCGLLAGPPLA